MDQTTDQFIQQLCNSVLNSPAVNHPYLTAIATGDLPDTTSALQDFAVQYGAYSVHFTDYVAAVIENLASPDHKAILLENLAEEQGSNEGLELASEVDATIIGRPHAELFERFQQAVGVDIANVSARSSEAGNAWRQQFLDLCKMNECVGVGAVGIATELIVAPIYRQILCGLKTHGGLMQVEHVFFDLHSQADEKHAAQMMLIAHDLARDPTSRQQIEFGADTAINLRVAFWDTMLERAHGSSAIPQPDKLAIHAH